MLINCFNRFNLLIVFSLWRLLVFIPLTAGAYLIPYNLQSPVAYIYKYTAAEFSFDSIYLNPWVNFDGIHYLNIARDGYTNQARFFPLFPLILKTVSAAPVASVFLVTIIFFIAIYFFYKLMVLDFTPQTARQSLIYLLLFPTSFFFVSIYSEGLFLLLVILSFYFARKKRWFLSILFAMLLIATRFVGMAILPALLYEFFTNDKVKIKKLALFLIMPLGLLAYSIFNFYQWGNFLYFYKAQGELGNNRSVSSVILFPQTIFRYFKILSTVPINSYEWGIALLELASFTFASVLLYIAWKQRIRTSYLIFVVVNFAIAAQTGTFSGLPRYIITIFPIFMALALIRNKLLKIIYLVVSPVLLFILLMLFARGYFIA